MYQMIVSYDGKIAEQDKQLKAVSREREECRRLVRGPGIGVNIATVLLSLVGRAGDNRLDRLPENLSCSGSSVAGKAV